MTINTVMTHNSPHRDRLGRKVGFTITASNNCYVLQATRDGKDYQASKFSSFKTPEARDKAMTVAFERAIKRINKQFGGA